MKLKAYIYFLVLFLALSYKPKAYSQVKVQATVDSTEMLIGDHRKLSLRVVSPTTTNVNLSDFTELEDDPNIELINQGTWSERTSGSEKISENQLTFSIYDSGYYTIPQLPFTYLKGVDTFTVFSNDIPMFVHTLKVDSTFLTPIKEIREEPMKLEDLLPYLLGIGGLALIGGLIYWLTQRKKEEEVIVATPIIIPPHEIALEKLATLKNQGLWQSGKVKEYQSKLTFIVREYLEGRYDILALESTSYEIIEDLKKLDISSDYVDQLKKTFEMADLVKFAKANPPVDIHERLMKEAIEFVSTTKKTIVEPVEEGTT